MARLRLSALLLLCALALACVDGRAGASGPKLTARRGSLRPRLLLTGELAAARALELKVPQTSNSQLQIRWMERDGTPVRAGQRVVDLDNTSFTSELEEKRSKASQAADELARKEAEARSTAAEKAFQVEKNRTEVAKARQKANVPEGIFSAREVQDRQLALKRAETELAKAEADLTAFRQESAADLKLQGIELEKSRREIRAAEKAISVLSLRAPRDGIVQTPEHPWEGRKVEAGDSVWPGMTVAALPDLASLVVEAQLSDVDDGRIAPGMAASCTLDAYLSETFRCRVAEIAPVARERSSSSLRRYFPVRVTLDRLDRRMRPGMSVRVEVLGPEVQGLIVPREALDFPDPASGSPRALLADGGAVPVRLGPCTAAECLVEGSLKDGTPLRPRP
ncbi:MAG: efflux RND transporter periplasmic adaptor subunit [Acidobacteriota bacterium]